MPKKTKKLRIAFCGGGTGGHYYPAVALLEEIGKREDFELIYFTVKGKLDDKSIEGDFPGVKKVPLEVKGLIRPLHSPGNISILFSHFKAQKKVLNFLKEFRPDFLFSTGGYVSFPVIKAAFRKKIPIYIHEQNSMFGITNRKMARFAFKVFTSFQETRNSGRISQEKIVFSGNPVREAIKSRKALLEELGFSQREPFVVVLGGSLGSSLINDCCERVYDLFIKTGARANFLHSTGDEEKTKSLLRFPFVRPFTYVERLIDAIAVSDLVVCRGGATSIAELQYYGRKGIIIPWSGSAENHQLYNALSLEKTGLGYVILESALAPGSLFDAIKEMLLRKVNYTPPRRPVEIILDNILREE